MLDRYTAKGVHDALARFGIKEAEVPPGMLSGLLGKAKAFGAGQVGAAKDLFANLRGGFGGTSNLGNVGHMAEGASGPAVDITQLHRHRALGNMKTLTPSLLAGGALYLRHHGKQQAREEQMAQQQMQDAMAQGGGGYPMM